MITQEQLDWHTQYMQEQGFIVGETFGYEAGVDFPMAHLSSNQSLSKFWYRFTDPITSDTITASPWLAEFIESPSKLTINISL